MGALGVAVSCAELGTRVVVAHAHIARGVHGGEIDGTVETAGEGRKVDVEGELLVQKVEHLVSRVVLHEVQARADVGSGLEVEGERVAGGSHAVGARVVRAVESAVLGAGLVVRAVGGIPLVASVAVLKERMSEGDTR